MSNTWLTNEEIQELTDKKTRTAQKNVLNHLGLTYKETPDGNLKILRDHVKKEFDGFEILAATPKNIEPDWSRIDA